MKSLLFTLTILFSLCIQVSMGLMFEVKTNVERCIMEEIRESQLVTGMYAVSDKLSRNRAYPYEHIQRALQMSLIIYDPKSIVVFTNNDAKQGSFAFTADEQGTYTFCFKDTSRPSAPVLQITSRTVDLTIKTGEEDKDYEEVAKRENLEPIEIELRKVEDIVSKVRDEMMYQKDREEALRDTNESTNSRVAWLTVFCFVVLIGSTSWQLLT
eukprot:TRINITY_DN896_c0_g1_i2.p1 TRINITY_DN896_c0_g1~~TRINITY_DN896_c0_g1_i2.p1  ORF type:complete len:212 (+),score=55.73 TRINITY_DN896_c0_g1_i2:184-819(+)